MNRENVLVFVPTYNERENVQPLFEQLMALKLPLDVLFLDDNSPDGTGEIMDAIAGRHSNVHVIHRSGKLGIGSAHKTGIRWAYQNGYRTLVTMDADFTHSPGNIPDFLARAQTHEVVVGSRYLLEKSLKGWNLMRKFLTRFGHILTTVLLGLPHDCTGAFRLYRLDRIPEGFLSLVESDGYSFFFESLFILSRNHFRIAEVPIALPPRTYGSSKMSYGEIFRSLRQLFMLCKRNLLDRKSCLLAGGPLIGEETA